MTKQDFIKLTQNLYRLTLLFPKKEPLRYKMREIANNILLNPDEDDFETLNCFLEVAKTQNWVSPFNVLEIQEEYDKLRQDLFQIRSAVEKPAVLKADVNNLVNNLNNIKISDRQKKILQILKNKEKVQVWQAKEMFPEITKRTLRRDFESLLNQGLIKRIGKRNETFYELRGRA